MAPAERSERPRPLWHQLALEIGDLPLGLPADHDLAAVLLAAEDRRDLQPLLVSRGSQSASTRARLALSIGRVGLPGGVPALLGALADPAPEVRALAAFGLGRIEYDLGSGEAAGLRQRAADALAARLGDEEPLVAAQAAWALGVLGEPGALEPLLEALTGGGNRPGVIQQALGAWWRLPGAGLAPVVDHLGSDDVEVRLAAVNALRRLGDPSALPRLVPMLDDPDATVRAAAARGLRDTPATVAAVHVPRLLDDADGRVVAEALLWIAGAWAEADSADAATVGAVLRASLERDAHVRGLALAALARRLTDWPVARDRLQQGLDDPDPGVRMALLDGLTAAGIAAARELLGGVRRRYGLDGRPQPSTPLPASLADAPLEAAAVAGVLGVVHLEEADDWLERLYDAGPTAARAAVLRQWQERDPRRAAEAARQLLLAEAEPVLRGVAAEVVETLEGRGSLPRLDDGTWGTALWRAQGGLAAAAALEPRLLALSALEAVAPELLGERASILLTDEDRVARLWALRNLTLPEALRPPDVVVPVTTRRTDEDYRRLAERLLGWQQDAPRLTVSTPRGEFVIALRPDAAPLTVAAIVDWAEQGFYDGVVFHRVVPDFVVQAGDPTATGYGGAPGSLRSEETPLPYDAGTVGLALAGRDTGNSQLFITHSPQPHLQGLYPVLGTVVEGRRVIDRIQRGDTLDVEVVGDR